MNARNVDAIHEAEGALSAQRALQTLGEEPGAEGVLMATLLASDGKWRTSSAWLTGWFRQIEKALTR